jgi:2-succinyl-5-enolpyruvyl-6-hydroxy-3-cyclohexene-1-carboxylate synthase
MAAAGVRDAIVAPGSRSAPLALAFDRSGVRTHVAIDERAGAYFALGLARASRRPVAVVTTSGTAAANLHPAALEAFHGRVPLILLTADRPAELRGTGAPQTIDQIALFGTGVRWFADAGTPEAGSEGLRHAASLGARAAAVAWGPPAGPVHLNLPFREPLLPEPEAMGETMGGAPRSGVGAPSSPDAVEAPVASAPPAAAIRRVARALRTRRQGVIVCGPLDGGADFAAAVARLAAATGYPILADPLSGVRFGEHDRSNVCGLYDLFLRAPRFAERASLDAIIQFGAPLTSKTYHLHAARHPDAYRVIVDEGGEPRDPSRLTRDILKGDPAAAAAALADALETSAEPLPGWGDDFRRAERAAADAVARHLAASPALGEEGVFPAILDAMPAGGAGDADADAETGGILYVGNSMPIRDLDLAAPPSRKRVRVLGNRGVNGIDGVLSSALGASAAGDLPLAAVVGDLSFHHDLNGLAALREGRAHATIVVIQNDGGGIFSFLPVARHDEVFERYFGTPHGLDAAKAAALYGIPHHRCATAEELRDRARASLPSRASVILEVRTDRAGNRAAHQALAEAARRAVEEAL